ncbi:MAG: hypothetical protein K6G47_05420 [Clostridia bacterium]|nr:hypothetical protein [Clostridia bacterium]
MADNHNDEIIVFREKGADWLNDQLDRYATFSSEAKKNIIFVCAKNLLYVASKDKRNLFLPELSGILTDENPFVILNRIRHKSIGNNTGELFDNTLKELVNRLACGKCPLVYYAFGKHLCFDSSIEPNLLEMSLMYLFRYESVRYDIPSGYVRISSSGSNCEIYKNTQLNKVCKIAKNFGSRHYLIEQEFENAMILGETDLSCYIPKHYEYNRAKGWLFHENIQGETAAGLLRKGRLPLGAYEQLESFYSCYMNRRNKEIILDIHPENFVWNYETERLYLIDLGSIPKIGSEYYEYDLFEDYFSNIFLRWEDNIKKYPIRSMDLEVTPFLCEQYGE